MPCVEQYMLYLSDVPGLTLFLSVQVGNICFVRLSHLHLASRVRKLEYFWIQLNLSMWSPLLCSYLYWNVTLFLSSQRKYGLNICLGRKHHIHNPNPIIVFHFILNWLSIWRVLLYKTNYESDCVRHNSVLWNCVRLCYIRNEKPYTDRTKSSLCFILSSDFIIGENCKGGHYFTTDTI
jgi:hypothetical protein